MIFIITQKDGKDYHQDGFRAMAKITRILVANIRGQFFFDINTAESTRYLVENFQLICCLQRVNTRHNTTTVVVQDV